MNIDNNVNAMRIETERLNTLAKNVKEATEVTKETQTQEVTDSLINSIVEQIPTQIAYEANGTAITTKNEVMASTINIKA